MKTRINPGALNPMEMNNISSMMGMMNNIQKIGKSKRKYSINLEKGDKKLLVKFINEAKKQFSSTTSNDQYAGVYSFLNYVVEVAEKKETTDLKLSFEEYEFLKKMLIDSVKGMEKMTFFWYQFIRKGTVKILIKQYRELLKKFK